MGEETGVNDYSLILNGVDDECPPRFNFYESYHFSDMTMFSYINGITGKLIKPKHAVLGYEVYTAIHMFKKSYDAVDNTLTSEKHKFGHFVRFEEKKPVIGRVYFMVAGDYVKIGFTSGDVTTRRDQLQTGCPLELNCIHSVESTMFYEKALHSIYWKFRVRDNGEWFRYTGGLKNYIQKVIDRDDKS